MAGWRAVRRWLFGAVLLTLAALHLALLVLVLVPLPRRPLLAAASVLVTCWSTPALAGPALLGLLLAVPPLVVAGRRRRRPGWTVVVALTTSLAALLGGLAPYAAAWRTAQVHGEGLSLREQFSGVNYAKGPDHSRTLIYGRIDKRRMKMDVWLPRERPRARRPAVVWVHGGGWESGHRSQTPRWNQWLNDRGFAVFDIDYRLAPRATQLQQIGDVKCAIGWVRGNAARYDVDPGRIILAGTSAGANLALSAAYTARDPQPRASCRARDTSVRAVVSLYGPTDMAGLIRTGADPADPAVRRFMGGSLKSASDRFRLGSPAQLARADVPPTLLLHGSHDRLVPVAQARELSARLSAAGAVHEYVEIPWADHAFDYNWGNWGTQIARPVLARFLDVHARR
ncbi:alpha/beta hydrolase fold domain-containing protein [Streptomyces sp. URMC 123]|uniref:alpha/beta hydrolase fold domain-containing protein n=1 Tax=Streptomyces sp. URMC 123 TaxID=3423403 RepID=UPI003F1E2435